MRQLNATCDPGLGATQKKMCHNRYFWVKIRVRTTKQYNDIDVKLPDVNTCPCYMQENTLTVRKRTMKYLGLEGHRVCNLPPNEKQYTWDKMLTEST